MTAGDASRGARSGRAWYLAAGALLCLAFVAQCVLSMRLMSASSDEHAHLPAGYTHLKSGQQRLNPQHPPLVKLLSALPLLFLKPKVDWNDETWTTQPNEWLFGRKFLYEWGNDADRLLFWGRVPVVVLALILAVFVFRWSWERFGPGAAVFALLLFAFCPNVIAHARFVTMDVALATFVTAAAYYAWRHSRDGDRRSLVLCGAAFGLALASKFSAVVLAPLFLAWVALRPESWSRRPESSRVVTGPRPAKASRKRRRRDKTESAAPPASSIAGADALGRGWATALFAGVAVVVLWVASYFPADPGFYLRGVARVNQDHNPNYPAFLLGEFRQGGFWYYFAAAFAMKTPVPALVSMIAAAILAWRSRASTGRDDAFLVLPALVFFVATSALADNIGVRYVLPVFPLLFVFASRIAAGLTGTASGAAVVVVLAAWQMWGALHVYPDYLAYFNELAGGPGRGHLRLDDSNIDWGQDLKRLKRYLDEEKLGRVRLVDAWGDARYYGIDFEPAAPADLRQPRPGVYAFSTHLLIRMRASGDPDLDWLRRYPPIGQVGYSFYLFRF